MSISNLPGVCANSPALWTCIIPPYRLLKGLADEGWLTYDPQTQRYQVDVEPHRIGLKLASRLDIAASLPGGLRRNFGTMTKPLHAGLAAQLGVQAALLAERGRAADLDIFGPGGFFLAFGGGQTEQPDWLPLGEPLEVESSGLAVKMFPYCYATHRIIDCTLSLSQEHDLTESDVESIMITAPAGALAPLNRPRPPRGQVQRRIHHGAALTDRCVNLASFTDEAVLRPNLQSLLRRVRASELDPLEEKVGGFDDGEVVVSIAFRDGRKLAASSAYPPGSSGRPMTEQASAPLHRRICLNGE